MMKIEVRSVKSEVDHCCGRPMRYPLDFTLHSSLFTLRQSRSGISLIEILISMFVLLFGLMGVAMIFPVGDHYVIEGEKFDMGSSLAQNAFEELGCRGMLKPKFWHYADPEGNLGGEMAFANLSPLMQPNTLPKAGQFNITSKVGPGHAFVLDPMGAAAGADPAIQNLDIFPYYDFVSGNTNTANPWNSGGVPTRLSGSRWPLRRLTVLDTLGLMRTNVAETIFNLRDDLVVDQPDEGDRPSIQTWDLDNSGTNPLLLRRQYTGNYNWLATIVPQTEQALDALQPADPNSGYSNYRYDVSVVVFRKRETLPSEKSERLITAALESDGNLVLYHRDRQEIDAVTEDIRPGNWIALTGVNQATGGFMMKWYRLLAIDQAIDPGAPRDRENIDVDGSGAKAFYVHRAMLDGPSWPLHSPQSYYNLRAVILPGIIGVATQELTMEGGSLRSYE